MATVVVAYDSAQSLPATLRSIQAQLEPGDELVVVDNASRDASAQVAARAVPTARVIRLEANEGFGAGCHAGAAATAAPLLFFCNPDVQLAEGCLAALRTTAVQQPDWGAWQALVLLPGGEMVNSSGGVTHWLGLAWAGGCGRPVAEVARKPHEVSFASGAALVVRRRAWDSIGGFDPRYFMYGEDVDLSLRLRLAGWTVGLVPRARVEHEYEFLKGDYKWFHLERNRWWTVLSTYPAPVLGLVLVPLAVLEVTLLGVAARGGWLGAKLRAQGAVVRSAPWILRRRRRLQPGRSVSAGDFAAGLTASLDSPFLGAMAEVAVIRAAQRGYWRAAQWAVSRPRAAPWH